MLAIAETIRDLRNAREITQAGLAQISGVSRHTISDIESGSCDPQVSTLTAILNALGMEIRVRPVPMKPMAVNTYDYDVERYFFDHYPVKEDGWDGAV